MQDQLSIICLAIECDKALLAVENLTGFSSSRRSKEASNHGLPVGDAAIVAMILKKRMV
jgi:hypothetical protein